MDLGLVDPPVPGVELGPCRMRGRVTLTIRPYRQCRPKERWLMIYGVAQEPIKIFNSKILTAVIPFRSAKKLKQNTARIYWLDSI